MNIIYRQMEKEDIVKLIPLFIEYWNGKGDKWTSELVYSRGYAKEMLKMALPYCREIGLDRVLITCIYGNVGSEKTILDNGGVYESMVYEPNEKEYLKRFWIEL